MKVLLKRFHFNGHTARLGPQSQRLDSPYKTVDIASRRVLRDLSSRPLVSNYPSALKI